MKIYNNLKASAILFLTLIFMLMIPAAASANEQRIIDTDNILNEQEINKLEKQADKAAEKTGMNIAVLIDSGSQTGKNSYYEDYADVYYENLYGINSDGVLLYIRFDPNYVHISTSGSGIDYFDDERIEDMLDDIAPKLSDDEVYGAVGEFFQNIEFFYDRGLPGEYFNWAAAVGISLGISVVIAGIAGFFIAQSYKKNKSVSSVSYASNNNTNFYEKSDSFLRQYVTKTKIETSSSNSGSSTHTSSGGGTHGGGGRSF